MATEVKFIDKNVKNLFLQYLNCLFVLCQTLMRAPCGAFDCKAEVNNQLLKHLATGLAKHFGKRSSDRSSFYLTRPRWRSPHFTSLLNVWQILWVLPWNDLSLTGRLMDNGECAERWYKKRESAHRAREQLLPDGAPGRTPDCLTFTQHVGLAWIHVRLLSFFFYRGWIAAWSQQGSSHHRQVDVHPRPIITSRANYPAQLWAIILVISQAAINKENKKWSLFPGQYLKVRVEKKKNTLRGFKTALRHQNYSFSGCVMSYSHTSPINQAYG